jgi:hypothetical protein
MTETTAATPPENATLSRKWTIRRVVTVSSIALGGSIAAIFLIGLALAVFFNVDDTSRGIQIIRDIFIIVLSLEGILIIGGLAVFVLQIARLVGLLQSEVKPVLNNTQETIQSAKGTVDFVGKNVAGPAIRVSAFLAGAGVLVRELGGIRRAIQPTPSKENSHETK